MSYINKVENQDITIQEQDQALFNCFIPMLVLSGLWLLKIICFKVKNSIINLAFTFSIASLAFACESKFDNDIQNAPLFIIAIPISCILLSISFSVLTEMYFEPDECIALFNSYDSRFKRMMAIFNVTITVMFVVSLILALYFLELKITNA
jgi:hypothetical protein